MGKASQTGCRPCQIACSVITHSRRAGFRLDALAQTLVAGIDELPQQRGRPIDAVPHYAQRLSKNIPTDCCARPFGVLDQHRVVLGRCIEAFVSRDCHLATGVLDTDGVATAVADVACKQTELTILRRGHQTA
ncbi:hypothetical protein D3C73_1106950 [compost metagenome]